MVTVYKPDKTTPDGHCHPAVARQLLRDEEAVVVRLQPFSIARVESDDEKHMSEQAEPSA